MIRRILLSLFIILIFTSPLIAQTGFFFEGGVGSKYHIGNMSYVTPPSIPGINGETGTSILRDYISTPTYKGLHWNNKFAFKYQGSIGFRFSNKNNFKLNYGYYRKLSKIYNNTGRPDTNNDPSGIIMGGADYNNSAISNSLHAFRLSYSYFFKNNIFFKIGLEYSLYKNNYTSQVRVGGLTRSTTNPFQVDIFGFILGVGYERPVYNNMSLVSSVLYNYSIYSGNTVSYDELEINLGGFELDIALRYYIK